MGASDFHERLRGLRYQFAVPGDARQPVFLGDAGERRGAPGIERAGAAHVHVHAGIGRRHLDVEWFVCRLQYLGDRPGRRNGAVEAGRKNGAAVDGDNVMCARRREADLEQVVAAAPCMEHRAAAALPMRVDDIGHRRDDAGLLKRLRHQPALPQGDIRRATNAAWRSRRIG